MGQRKNHNVNRIILWNEGNKNRKVLLPSCLSEKIIKIDKPQVRLIK